MTCIGKVSQGKVLLPSDVHLPDGTCVRVDTIESEAARAGSVGKFSDFIGIADDLPPDLASNLDHYLHGHPRE